MGLKYAIIVCGRISPKHIADAIEQFNIPTITKSRLTINKCF